MERPSIALRVFKFALQVLLVIMAMQFTLAVILEETWKWKARISPTEKNGNRFNMT